LDFDVALGAPEDIFFRFGRGRLSGPLSRRRDSFPSAIQHDSVLSPSLCGGPVVDLAGKVVGINIARADRIATYATPADVVKKVLDKLRSHPTAAIEANDGPVKKRTDH
jgi:S1-C subfamily serine protease